MLSPGLSLCCCVAVAPSCTVVRHSPAAPCICVPPGTFVVDSSAAAATATTAAVHCNASGCASNCQQVPFSLTVGRETKP